MLVIDYNKRFSDEEIENWNLQRKIRMEALRNQSNKWFADNWLVNKLVNKYEYFATFQFDKEWVKDKSFDELSNSIRHYKNILHKKLFGRQEFRLNFFPVIETVKWSKELKKYLPVRPHTHILLGEVPSTARIGCEPKTFFTDCWMEMKNAGLAKDQQVIEIYGGNTTKSAESYITKLKHSNVDWFDGKNYCEVKQVFDEDITDWIERHSENILASYLSK